MLRSLPLVALALLLAACDSSPVEPEAAAKLAVGETYSATTFSVSDAASGATVVDFLQVGAAFDITFDDATRFTARIAFPAIGGGEGEEPFDASVSGTYVQTDTAVTFLVDDAGDETMLQADGWTVQRDARSLRVSEVADGARIDLVLTRR